MSKTPAELIPPPTPEERLTKARGHVEHMLMTAGRYAPVVAAHNGQLARQLDEFVIQPLLELQATLGAATPN